jgi:hypothetical protein
MTTCRFVISSVLFGEDFCFDLHHTPRSLFQITVQYVYNDISLYDALPIASDIL